MCHMHVNMRAIQTGENRLTCNSANDITAVDNITFGNKFFVHELTIGYNPSVAVVDCYIVAAACFASDGYNLTVRAGAYRVAFFGGNSYVVVGSKLVKRGVVYELCHAEWHYYVAIYRPG